MRRIAWALPAAAALVCGCSAGPSAPQAASQSPAAPRASATASPTPPPNRPPQPGPGNNAASAKAQPDTASGGPELFRPTRTGILLGKVVAVDPGHNGGNFDAASVIGKLIWNGRETETCDTTGAETDGGYTEAQFNWDVALYLTADLRAEGATVALTRTSDAGVDRASPSAPRSATRSTPTRPSPSTLTEGRLAGGGSPSWNRSPTDPTTPSSAPLSPSAPTCAPHSPAGPGSPSAATTEPTVSSPATTWPASTSPASPRCSSNVPTCATPLTPRWSPLCGGRPRPPARSPPR